jgi:hypothetical protein
MSYVSLVEFEKWASVFRASFGNEFAAAFLWTEVSLQFSGLYCPGPTFRGVETMFSSPDWPARFLRQPSVNLGGFRLSLRCGGRYYGPGLASWKRFVTRFSCPKRQLADFLIVVSFDLIASIFASSDSKWAYVVLNL